MPDAAARRFSVRATSPIAILLLTSLSCGGEVTDDNRPVEADDRTAELVLELTIGDDMAAAPEYQFSSILSVLAAPDGSLWVLDGDAFMSSPMDSGETPYLRRFDSDGAFLGYVGGQGAGPGEFGAPYRLGLIPDGRVALRDSRQRRVTLYTPDGDLDATMTLAHLSSTFSPWSNMTIDERGILWLEGFWSSDGQFGGGFVRMRPDGTVVDTIPHPALPGVRREVIRIVRTLPSGGRSTRDITVPYYPRAVWTWDPRGAFAVARTDEYRVELLPPPGSEGPPTVVSREVDPVPLSEAEREAIRETLLEEVEAAGGGVEVPEIPTVKPPIRDIWDLDYTADGRLMVWVSMPSRLEEGAWIEPRAFDLFDRAGGFVGRVVLPESFNLLHMKGDHIWGIVRDEFDVESVRRYRVVWPNGSGTDG